MDRSILVAAEALLEREHEVERIRSALRGVGRREGAVVVIEGAGGIGKSRLLEVARSRGSDLGFRVLSARATELEQGFPYGVVRQLFERLLSEADAGDRDRWLSGAAALAADVLIGAPTVVPPAQAPGPAPDDPSYAWQHGLYCLRQTSRPTRRWWSRWTICSGPMRRRSARSPSSPAASAVSRSR